MRRTFHILVVLILHSVQMMARADWAGQARQARQALAAGVLCNSATLNPVAALCRNDPHWSSPGIRSMSMSRNYVICIFMFETPKLLGRWGHVKLSKRWGYTWCFTVFPATFLHYIHYKAGVFWVETQWLQTIMSFSRERQPAGSGRWRCRWTCQFLVPDTCTWPVCGPDTRARQVHNSWRSCAFFSCENNIFVRL